MVDLFVKTGEDLSIFIRIYLYRLFNVIYTNIYLDMCIYKNAFVYVHLQL